MSDPSLSMGQYSIGVEGGPATVYGWGTPLQIAETVTDTGTENVQDQAVVGRDGLAFGVDTMPGMIVTQSGQVFIAGQNAAVMDWYGEMAGAWNNVTVRMTDGAVQVLRAWYPYSQVIRRCYGRGRKIMPTLGSVNQGLNPFTAQFQASDGIWYSDVLSSITLTMVPSFIGGLAPPWTPPLIIATQTNTAQNAIANTGPQPTWPVITFTGPTSGTVPLTNPSVAWAGTPFAIGYGGTVAPGQSLVIDTRPWAGTCLLAGVSAAGGLTGSQMAQMQLPPGTTTAVFGGQDPTGTATCTVAWRSAFLSIGGTLL